MAICKQCNSAQPDGNRFCGNCGCPMDELSAEETQREDGHLVDSEHTQRTSSESKPIGNRLQNPCSPPSEVGNTSTSETDRKAIVSLSEDLTHLGYWGFHNLATEIASLIFPGLWILVGLAITCLNPIWWIVGPIFNWMGKDHLESGNIDSARKSLLWGRCTNWLIVLGVLLYFIFRFQHLSAARGS